MTEDNLIVLNFADSKVPEFKEVRNKDFILYGEDNDYANYLLYLYNKSSKHNAIINTKCNYILANGFQSEQSKVFLQKANRVEDWNELMNKAVKDLEVFGGYYFQVIWGFDNKIAEVYHIGFNKLRVSKDGMGYYFKKNWKDRKEDMKFYPKFTRNGSGVQIFSFKEYRPDIEWYPLPGYVGAQNYIETDIEISKFHLSSIKNGFMPSKMIVFNNGEPTDDKKKTIEKRFKDKFAGSENAGRFILVFNTDPAKAPIINDLSANDLDKQFDILNKTVQQEVMAGHQITSAMLFGIAEPGKLGGRNELLDSYKIFVNTYAKPKQKSIEQVVNYFAGVNGFVEDITIQQADPLGLELTDNLLTSIIPKQWVLEQLDIPEKYWSTQQQLRFSEDEEVKIFEGFGESKDEYEIAATRKIDFDSEFSFAEDVKASVRNILELISKDKRITNELIAETLDVSEQWVVNKIAELVKKKLLGDDGRTLLKPISEIEPEQLFIRYSYDWGNYVPGADRNLKTSRPFCQKLMGLNRLYSRSEIEQISATVGYSVFDRRGGFWTRKGTDKTTAYCRHQWFTNIVKKKR